MIVLGGFATGGGPPLPSSADLRVTEALMVASMVLAVALALVVLWGAWRHFRDGR